MDVNQAHGPNIQLDPSHGFHFQWYLNNWLETDPTLLCFFLGIWVNVAKSDLLPGQCRLPGHGTGYSPGAGFPFRGAGEPIPDYGLLA